MRRFFYLIFILIFASNIEAYSIEYEGIYDNNQVVYSPSSVFWSEGAVSKDSITLVKHTADTIEKSSNYKFECGEVKLNSNFEFLFSGRLIGVDNDNLKFYELIYKDNAFVESPLSYEQVQEIFADTDVIKISDFSKGTYNIINHADEKEILIFNDTEETFDNYSIMPEKSAFNKDIKANIKIPRRGKITISDIQDETKKVYTIKVR